MENTSVGTGTCCERVAGGAGLHTCFYRRAGRSNMAVAKNKRKKGPPEEVGSQQPPGPGPLIFCRPRLLDSIMAGDFHRRRTQHDGSTYS